MDRKNLRILILFLSLAAAAAAVLLFLSRGAVPAAAGDVVIISVDGREYTRVPLSEPQTVTVRQGEDMVNVIEVSDHGAVMRSSTCENQLCVHMGEVTLDNWEWRVNGAFIICLPNRVSVELVAAQQ